jgi:hypothetical protein
MARTTDQNELRLIGANPYMINHLDPKEPPTTHVSIWRIEVSPAGAGHTLFWFSEITENKPCIYADNVGLARWLQEEIVRGNMPYKDSSLPCVQATFTWSGAVPEPVTCTVQSEHDLMTFTWSDFLPAFHGTQTPEDGETHGHYACYVPARSTRVTLNGVESKSQPIPRERDGYEHSTSFLALNESWTRVRAAK